MPSSFINRRGLIALGVSTLLAGPVRTATASKQPSIIPPIDWPKMPQVPQKFPPTLHLDCRDF